MHTLLTLPYFSCFLTIPLQWGTVNAGDFALPISFISKYSAVACDTGSANAAIKVNKKSNSMVNFYGRDYAGNGYENPYVTFIAVGV